MVIFSNAEPKKLCAMEFLRACTQNNVFCIPIEFNGIYVGANFDYMTDFAPYYSHFKIEATLVTLRNLIPVAHIYPFVHGGSFSSCWVGCFP